MPFTQVDASALPLPGIVISNEELGRRPTRIPDFELESRTLRRLSRTLTVAPDELLQMLVNTLVKVCQAGSAGVSLLEDEDRGGQGAHFRWVATAGGLAGFAGHRMPRNFSPCGTTLDVDRTLLMRDPAAHFSYINQLPTPICEVLLIPFHRDGVAIGTVWVATHDPERQFDLEDMRLMGSISQFAAAATQVVVNAATSNRAHIAARHAVAVELADLTEEHRKLAGANREKAELLATVTHEFRNVVAPLPAALEIIKRSEDLNMRTKAREIMERQVQQMNRLIEDLLDTSRLASGKLRLDLQRIDVGEVVRNAVYVARSKIEASGQSLATAIPPGHWQLHGGRVEALSEGIDKGSEFLVHLPLGDTQ